MASNDVMRRINKVTGVTRRNVNKTRVKNARNTFRRKSSGGQGG